MDKLQQNDVLLVFTYAPAGLGHLRVTDALLDGLPKDHDYVVLGAGDTRISYWHRLISIHPTIRELSEKLQGGRFRFWFYAFYTWLLRLNSNKLYRLLKDLIISQRYEKKVVVIVSTHFGLAIQIAAIKEKLQKDLKIRLILVDQITDATSMEILYVPEADLIFVPSLKVRADLLKYARHSRLHETNIVISPYPLSPKLSLDLTENEYYMRLKQYDFDSSAKIKIVVPISGAAVGLKYFDELIYLLGKTLDRCEIYVVAKDYMYTHSFIRKMKRRSWVKVIADQTDRKVVADYEKLYQDEVIGLEVVKPSEQAFKTLFTSKKRGGAILMLTEPIGKQEHDNLNFLIDHHLIPNHEHQTKLEQAALSQKNIPGNDCAECQELSKHWKAIRLTNDPIKDARIIIWCLKRNIFSNMAINTRFAENDPELAPNGVSLFWQKVEDII